MATERGLAIITGASSGIGRALGLVLASQGHKVGLIARRRPELDALAAEITLQGGTALAATADVGDRGALRSAIAEIETRLGPVEVMIANAGIAWPTRLDPLNTSEVEAMFQINLMGVVYSIEAVLPGMIARKHGQILAISSLAAFKGMPGESAYCASKAAVNAYMEGLRIALRGKNVAITTVCPGFVKTDMLPMGTMTPFLMSAHQAAVRIAKVVANRKAGLVQFPWAMARLTHLLARLPDGVVARFFPDPATSE